MRLVTWLIMLGLLAAGLESCQRAWMDEDAQRAAVGACLSHTYKTVAQCQEAP